MTTEHEGDRSEGTRRRFTDVTGYVLYKEQSRYVLYKEQSRSHREVRALWYFDRRPATDGRPGSAARRSLSRVRMATVEIRGAQGQPVQRVLRGGVSQLRSVVEGADRELPGFVWRELEQTARCGDPAGGFAWLHCAGCEHHRLVPFTCKGRGVCGSCIGRRMSERARWWCERVFPLGVPHRQWVVTVPWRRRGLLAWRPQLARGVLDRALGVVFGWLGAEADRRLGVSGGRGGAVTVEQRFGSSLALNLHFHAILPDGVFARAADGAVRFHRVSPDRAAIDALVEQIAEASEAWLETQGEDVDPDDGQAVLVSASTQGVVASGARAGRGVRRVGGGRAWEAELGTGSTCSGYGLHAGTVVSAGDRAGLERLSRYLLRPPVGQGRLTERPGGWHLSLRKPWRDGTTGFLFTTQELTEKLAALVPRPRVHATHFHGVFAAHAAWRAEVVPTEAQRAERAAAVEAERVEKRQRRLRRRTKRVVGREGCPWSELLAYVFQEDGLRCPHCARPLVLRTVVHRSREASAIVADLQRSARGPPGGGAPACP